MADRSRFDVELERIIETLRELQDDAHDCGEDAVGDKIAESLGSLVSAQTAAQQYWTGVLTIA